MALFGFITPTKIDFQGYEAMLQRGSHGINKKWNQRIQELGIPHFPLELDSDDLTNRMPDGNTSLADFVGAVEVAETRFGKDLYSILPSTIHPLLWSECPLLHNGQRFTDGYTLLYPKVVSE